MLLLGATSQLGYSIVRRRGPDAPARLTPVCSEHSRHARCRDWPRLNLDDFAAIRRTVREWEPDLLLHCGGICAVGKCERWPDHAWRINVESLEHLLDALPPRTRLVYCSSDHVFGGDRGPYRESDSPHPISRYGETRRAAEALVASRRPEALIVRHGLGIGPSIGGRTGHLDWLRYRTRHGLPTTVIEDEVRSAVDADDLAERIWWLAHSTIRGIRHVVATHALSRVELARALDERFAIGASLTVSRRLEQLLPHIGNVELATEFHDELARPLPGLLDPVQCGGR